MNGGPDDNVDVVPADPTLLVPLPLGAGIWNLNMGFCCSTTGAVEVAPLVAGVEPEPNRDLGASVGFAVVVPNGLLVPAFPKIFDTWPPDGVDAF